MKLAVLLFFTGLLVFYGACKTEPAGREGSPPVSGAGADPAPRPSGGGVAGEIRSLVETGSPGSLSRALEEIRGRDLGNSEFGRVMNAVAAVLIRRLYPDLQISPPPSDPPQTHAYTRIFRDIERGIYTAPQGGADYLELTLPFLALLQEGTVRAVPPESLLAALPDLRRAGDLNPGSVLAPCFSGFVYERAGRLQEASAEFARAAELAPDCYPAALGLARIREASGRRQEAIRLLSDLVVRFPDNTAIKRQLARSYYNNRDWSRAEPAVAELLQRHNRDGELLLMRAHIFVEQGQFIQAQTPLDLYASIDPNNRLYLFLRARVQAEGYRNRDAALNYLRALLRNNPGDDEAAVYTAQQLMASNRTADQNEGRALMRRLLDARTPSPAVISLVLQDAIRREAWREARPYAERLLAERRSSQDLLYAYTVERGLGNNAAALAYAREMYERDQSDEEGAIAYASALIDTGRSGEASRMIENRLASASGGSLKSRYYYLRSRLQLNEEAAMNDLRSSLFEDPRNLNALTAMFEIYHRRRDERRAVYYLKQALAISPDNPQLKRYEAEYRSVLGSF